MLIEAEVLTGYVLEEVLAALLHENGYFLLVDESQDKDALKNGHHGLLVRGRGANHQADALGELLFSIPFSLPVRLFAEAKFKGKAIGIADVRNALGLLNDVNERYVSDASHHLPFVRHHYRYALFSASGFTSDAQEFALTHQISLVDLQGPAFADLRNASTVTARKLRKLATSVGLDSFPVKQVRAALRKALGTWSVDQDPEFGSENDESGSKRRLLPEEDLCTIARTLQRRLQGRLLLGFPQGSFVLILQPDDSEAFDKFLAASPSQISVDIRFASNDSGETGEWALIPEGGNDTVVRFGIPPLLETWLLMEHGIDLDRVEEVKNRILPHITVFHHGNQLTQFTYRKVQGAKPADIVLHDNSSDLRDLLADPFLAYHASNSIKRDTEAIGMMVAAPSFENYSDQISLYREEWVVEEVAELFKRLTAAKASLQLDVIREAAAGEGVIPVGRVYELAGKAGPGVLRSLMRRVNSVMGRMIVEGVVRPGVTPPLSSLYLAGSQRASHYSVPKEFTKILSSIAIM